MRILILTVGGSDQPVVKSIVAHRPDFTIFLCTETTGENKGSRETVNGTGKVCLERSCPLCGKKEREDRESIAKQLGFTKETYEIHSVLPDDPYNTYEAALSLIKKHLEQGDDVIVDYTGGTKSMSVGLAMAAMEYPQCSLSLVKGKRLDLVKVRNGMERVARLPSHTVFVERQKKLCLDFIKKWDYFAAARVLEEISKIDPYISPDDEKALDRLLILCRSFSDWDRFAYQEALAKISTYKEDKAVSAYNKTLKQICATLSWYKNWAPSLSKKPPVFVLVYDVLLNAERRAAKGAYDDAVSRIYRALEMYGQFCLRTGKPSFTSDDIDVTLLPEEHRKYYEKKQNRGKVQIGLTENYDLLALLGHPVGIVWKKWRNTLMNVLSKRNYSFLAHGLQPVTEHEYRESHDKTREFFSECDDAQKIKEGLSSARQLPVDL